MINITKEFDNVLKPVFEKHNKGRVKSVEYRLSDLKLWGRVFDKQKVEIEIDYVAGATIEKMSLKFPIGEENNNKIVRPARDNMKFGDVELELLGIGKRYNVDGIKHIFKYQVNLKTLSLDLKIEPIIEKDIIPAKGKKKKEVKNGKNSLNSL